jgi:ribosomal protein L24, bacterial/organelle
VKQYRIHKDDIVVVTVGKDKGKEGRVLKLLRKSDRVLVEGVNIVVRHTKPNPQLQQPGGRIEKPMPVHVSNVALRCPSCQKVSRVGYRYLEAKEGARSVKVRFCKKCDKNFPQGGKKK